MIDQTTEREVWLRQLLGDDCYAHVCQWRETMRRIRERGREEARRLNNAFWLAFLQVDYPSFVQQTPAIYEPNPAHSIQALYEAEERMKAALERAEAKLDDQDIRNGISSYHGLPPNFWRRYSLEDPTTFRNEMLGDVQRVYDFRDALRYATVTAELSSRPMIIIDDPWGRSDSDQG